MVRSGREDFSRLNAAILLRHAWQQAGKASKVTKTH